MRSIVQQYCDSCHTEWAVEAEIGSRDHKKKMEKQDVLNARDEIRKLQEALRKGEDPGSTGGFMAKKPRASRKGFQKANGIKPSGNPDEQTAENFTAQKPTQAHTKAIEEKS